MFKLKQLCHQIVLVLSTMTAATIACIDTNTIHYPSPQNVESPQHVD